MPTSFIKEITDNVAIDSIPQAVSQQRITTEFINAVNTGFKLAINGNFNLIKSNNELMLEVFNGNKAVGKSQLNGIFENTNIGETTATFIMEFGLISAVEFESETFWTNLLDKSLMFVKIANCNSDTYFNILCKFLTQSTETDGEGNTSIVYTEHSKTIICNIINSANEAYAANNLVNYILPMKLEFNTIDESDNVYFTAYTTADIVENDHTAIWLAITELQGSTAALHIQKVDKTTTIAGVDLQDNVTKSELLSALNVADGADVNVQSDYAQTDTNADDYIKNKPIVDNIPTENSTNLVSSGAVKTALNTKQDAKPNGTDFLINPITGVIANEYLGANIYKFAGVFYPTGIIASDARYPELNNTNIADIDINTYGGITLIYSGTYESTHVGLSFKSGDFAQCLGITGWAKIDNTDAVTSVNSKVGTVFLKGSDIVVSDNNTNKIDEELALRIPFTQKDSAYGVASLDGFSKVPLAQIPAMPYTVGTVSANAFTADCTTNTHYVLTNSQDVVLTILNAYGGYYFEIEMHGGYALTLPANRKTDASFAYTTVLDNTQYYVYGFSYDGTNWRVIRNVYAE